MSIIDALITNFHQFWLRIKDKYTAADAATLATAKSYTDTKAASAVSVANLASSTAALASSRAETATKNVNSLKKVVKVSEQHNLYQILYPDGRAAVNLQGIESGKTQKFEVKSPLGDATFSIDIDNYLKIKGDATFEGETRVKNRFVVTGSGSGKSMVDVTPGYGNPIVMRNNKGVRVLSVYDATMMHVGPSLDEPSTDNDNLKLQVEGKEVTVKGLNKVAMRLKDNDPEVVVGEDSVSVKRNIDELMHISDDSLKLRYLNSSISVYDDRVRIAVRHDGGELELDGGSRLNTKIEGYDVFDISKNYPRKSDVVAIKGFEAQQLRFERGLLLTADHRACGQDYVEGRIVTADQWDLHVYQRLLAGNLSDMPLPYSALYMRQTGEPLESNVYLASGNDMVLHSHRDIFLVPGSGGEGKLFISNGLVGEYHKCIDVISALERLQEETENTFHTKSIHVDDSSFLEGVMSNYFCAAFPLSAYGLSEEDVRNYAAGNLDIQVNVSTEGIRVLNDNYFKFSTLRFGLQHAVLYAVPPAREDVNPVSITEAYHQQYDYRTNNFSDFTIRNLSFLSLWIALFTGGESPRYVLDVPIYIGNAGYFIRGLFYLTSNYVCALTLCTACISDMVNAIQEAATEVFFPDEFLRYHGFDSNEELHQFIASM